MADETDGDSQVTALCQLAQDYRGNLPTGGMLFEEKIDGWRALRLAGIDGKVRLWTRNGMPIEGVSHILQRLAEMEVVAGEPMFFDGEFQVGGTLADTKAWCETRWRQGGTAGIFHAFDCMTLAEWRAGGTDRPLIERKAMLRRLFAQGRRIPLSAQALRCLAEGEGGEHAQVGAAPYRRLGK